MKLKEPQFQNYQLSDVDSMIAALIANQYVAGDAFENIVFDYENIDGIAVPTMEKVLPVAVKVTNDVKTIFTSSFAQGEGAPITTISAADVAAAVAAPSLAAVADINSLAALNAANTSGGEAPVALTMVRPAAIVSQLKGRGDTNLLNLSELINIRKEILN